MSHSNGACECPLASKVCQSATLMRQRWFAAVRHADAAAMEKVAKQTGFGKVTREIFTVVDDAGGKTALHMAARDNLVEAMGRLLEMLEDKEFKQEIVNFPEEGTRITPLIEACICGSLDIVQALCEIGGAKWYLPDAKGKQPRHYADGKADILAFFSHQGSGALDDEVNASQVDEVQMDSTGEGAAAEASTEAIADEERDQDSSAIIADPGEVDESRSQGNEPQAAHSESQAASCAASGHGEEEGQVPGASGMDSAPSSTVQEEIARLETPLPFLSPRLAEEVMRVLCNVSFFEYLDPASLKELSRLCSQIQLLPGETLVRAEGDPISMYIIMRGKVLVEVEQLERIAPHPDRPWSIRHRLKTRKYRRRLIENDCFGESILLIGDKLSFRMEAEQETLLLGLSSRAFNRFIQHHRRVLPDIGSFLAGQLIEASNNVDDGQEADLALEMQKRISLYYNLPEDAEEVEDRERDTVRGIVEIPLAHSKAKQGLNIAHKVRSTHGNSWLRTPSQASQLTQAFGGRAPDETASTLYKSAKSTRDDGTGYLSYLRVCEDLSIRPRNSILTGLRDSSMHLENMSLTTKEARALGAALSRNAYIRFLTLSGNRLFDEGFVTRPKAVNESHSAQFSQGKGVLEAVCELPAQFEELNFQCTKLGKCTSYSNGQASTQCIDTLSRLAENNTAKALTCLKLGSNFLGNAGAIAISEALDRNFSSCQLAYLDISNNCIGDSGATAFGKMLSSNTSLVEVCAGWNHVSEIGSEAFFEGLLDNERLQTLHYSWNRIGERGGKALGRVFDLNKTLLRLDAQNCGIANANETSPETTCEAIAAGIKENKTMTCYMFQWNPLGQGCATLLDALISSPGKPLFSLENCSFNVLADGKRCQVDPRNLTQSYKFDLSVPRDREALQPLLELALKECGQNWRNERLNGECFHFPEEGVWTVPDSGILEFDFVDFEPFADDDDGDGVPDEMDNDNFRSLLQQLSRIISSDGRVEIIKHASFSYTFSPEQVILTLAQLPREIEKEEAMVYFFSRMRDREKHMPMVLLRCMKRNDLVNLQRRLGPGKVFDEYRPAGSYTLLISKAEDRNVLKRLRKMKAEGKFNGCDCKFVFHSGLLRGFKGEILESSIDVETIDLEQLAAETKSWATDFQAKDVDAGDDTKSAIKGEDEADDAPSSEAPPHAPAPRRHMITFDFEMLEMKKADFNTMFKGLANKGFAAQGGNKLPPIETSASVEEESEEHRTHTPEKVKKKKRSPAKKLSKMMSDANEEEMEEDLDRKTIFPIPHTGQDVEDIEQTKRFTSFTKDRRKTAHDKACKMIDDTSVRTKHVTPQGVKLRGGVKKWRPWATFSRSHKQDFDVHCITISQHGRAGKIHQVVQGALGEASCLNYSVDLSTQITHHTIPRVIHFCLSPRIRTRAGPNGQNGCKGQVSGAGILNSELDLALYANLTGTTSMHIPHL